jgi:hypothetical protein
VLQETSDMTPADREALAKAVKSLEHPSLAARLTNLVGNLSSLSDTRFPHSLPRQSHLRLRGDLRQR